MSTIDVSVTITDYAWAENVRPIITLAADMRSAHVQLGDGLNVRPITFDLTAGNSEDLVTQLQGLGEIFAKAAEVVPTVGQAIGCYGASLTKGK